MGGIFSFQWASIGYIFLNVINKTMMMMMMAVVLLQAGYARRNRVEGGILWLLFLG